MTGLQVQDRNGNASGADVATCIRERRNDLASKEEPALSRPFSSETIKTRAAGAAAFCHGPGGLLVINSV